MLLLPWTISSRLVEMSDGKWQEKVKRDCCQRKAIEEELVRHLNRRGIEKGPIEGARQILFIPIGMEASAWRYRRADVAE